MISVHQSKINQINTDANKNKTNIQNSSTGFNPTPTPTSIPTPIIFPSSNLINSNPCNPIKSTPNNQYPQSI